MISEFWKQKIVAVGGWEWGRAGLAKIEDLVERWPFLTPKTRSQGVPCERVHYLAKVWGAQVLFWGGGFCSTSSIFLVQHFYRTLLWLFCLLALEFAWHDSYYWIKVYKKNLLYRSCSFGNNWTSRNFGGPNSVERQGQNLNRLWWARVPDATSQVSRSSALQFWRRFLKGFYHIWAWWPFWSCDKQTFVLPFQWGSRWNMASIIPLVSEKMLENGWRTTDNRRRTIDNGRTMKHDQTISSQAAFGFGELKVIVFPLSHPKA